MNYIHAVFNNVCLSNSYLDIVFFVDSVWWTPSGQASGSQHQDGLVISDISEKDTGLYVCVSEEDQIVSVFNLQISKIAGARKSNLPRTRRQIIPPHTSNRIAEERNQRATQSDLALAVCLSIFFTFLITFTAKVFRVISNGFSLHQTMFTARGHPTLN